MPPPCFSEHARVILCVTQMCCTTQLTQRAWKLEGNDIQRHLDVSAWKPEYKKEMKTYLTDVWIWVEYVLAKWAASVISFLNNLLICNKRRGRRGGWLYTELIICGRFWDLMNWVFQVLSTGEGLFHLDLQGSLAKRWKLNMALNSRQSWWKTLL